VNRVVGLLFSIDQPAEQIRRIGGVLQALLKFGLLKQNVTGLFPSSNLLQEILEKSLRAGTESRYVLEKDEYPWNRCYDTQGGHSFLQKLDRIMLMNVSN
jgi:hypothetical protein